MAERRILAAAEQGGGRERGGRADRGGAAVEGEQAAGGLGGALLADELGVGGLERVGEDVEQLGGEGAGVLGALGGGQRGEAALELAGEVAGEGGGGLLVVDGGDDLLEAGDGVEGAGELLGDQVLVDTFGETGDATDTHGGSIARAGVRRQRRGATFVDR